jgi:hypothetical protein
MQVNACLMVVEVAAAEVSRVEGEHQIFINNQNSQMGDLMKY